MTIDTMTNYTQSALDYARVEQAILYLEENFVNQPSLAEVAARVGLSDYHFQRLFTRWAGISPKRFLQFLTVEYAKSLLDQSQSVLDVTYETGLSSPGRLHDLFITCEALTPGQFKKKGAGLTIRYSFHASPFGDCLMAVTDKGICGLSFANPGDHDSVFEALVRRWPKAAFVESLDDTAPLIASVFEPGHHDKPLRLYLQGSNFQLKVWQALLKIPPGMLLNYQTIAEHIGQPLAARAVGQATGANPIGFIIPCHRVIRKVGAIGGYRWGTSRKRAIFAWESAQAAA